MNRPWSSLQVYKTCFKNLHYRILEKINTHGLGWKFSRGRDAFDYFTENNREQSEHPFTKYLKNWSCKVTSWYFMNQIHVISRQTKHRHPTLECLRFSSLRRIQVKDRNKTSKLNCSKETSFLTPTDFSEMFNCKVVNDNY